MEIKEIIVSQFAEDDLNEIADYYFSLSPDYVEKIILTAQEKLKIGSLFVIGNYDEYAKIGDKLLNNGFFKPVLNCQNIFMRGDAANLYKRLSSKMIIGLTGSYCSGTPRR